MTYPEIATLVRGFAAEQRVQYDEEHGIKPEYRDGFDDFVDSLDGAESPNEDVPGSSQITPPGYTPPPDRRRSHPRR